MTHHCKVRFATRLAVLLATVLLGASAVQAQGNVLATGWSGVKVVDTHGWEYTNVTLRWVQDGQALKMRRPDGATKVFQPDEVARVFDAQGADITHEVGLARTDNPMPPAAVSPDGPDVVVDPVPVPVPVQRGAAMSSAGPKADRLFLVAVDAGAGYGVPTGSWFKGLDSGLNAQTGLRVMVGDRQYIHFSYRYQVLGKQFFTIYDYGYEMAVVEIESSIHEFQIMLGSHAKLEVGQKAKSVGYAEFGLASLNHQFSANVGGSPSGFNRYGYAGQGGVMLMMSETAALDFSLSVVWKPSWSGDEGSGFVLGAHAGLTFLL